LTPARFQTQVDPRLAETTIKATLEHQKQPSNINLSVVITDDREVQSLNRQYRGIDAPTDVLAFPAHQTDPDTDEIYIGDVLISYPQAEKSAQKCGHQVAEELSLLIVHGVLHLLGFDHHQPTDKERMWKTQAEILAGLGIPNLLSA
jgi:probable rRNA maturation factor